MGSVADPVHRLLAALLDGPHPFVRVLSEQYERGLIVRSLIAGLIALCSVSLVAGQDAELRFDVASIRENTSGSDEGSIGPILGGYAAKNIPLRLLIIRAYELRSFQVVGGPGWVDSARFDVNAKAPQGTSEKEVFPMLRALLADRFKLRLHQEQREMPIYVLTVARADGRVGTELKPSSVACADGRENPCRMGGSFGTNQGVLSAIGQPVQALATQLSTAVNRIVVDRTALDGRFDFQLTWGAGGFRAGDPRQDDPPSIFTALQEQLGLKLDAARGPVAVQVIDSAERPAAD